MNINNSQSIKLPEITAPRVQYSKGSKAQSHFELTRRKEADEFRASMQHLYDFVRLSDNDPFVPDSAPKQGEVSLDNFVPKWGAPVTADQSSKYTATLDGDGRLEISTGNGGRIQAVEHDGFFIARSDLKAPHNGQSADTTQFIEMRPDGQVLYISNWGEQLEGMGLG